jgi:hypothetical protein
MHSSGFTELVTVLVIAVLLFGGGGGKLGPAIMGMFRGGPRPPTHPIPGDDSEILNRPRPKPSSFKVA